MLLPSVTRTTEEVLKVVPSGLRRGLSGARGAGVGEPFGPSCCSTGEVWCRDCGATRIARIVGETAPLLFTAFGSQILKTNRSPILKKPFPLEI